LSNLYTLSQKQGTKRIGTQRLAPQKAVRGAPIDFSSQKEFGGIATVFVIETKGFILPEQYYTIDNGVIAILRTGDYTITMTNSKIGSDANYPAQVIVDVEVVSVDIAEAKEENFTIYPNPTTGQLTISLPNPSEGGAYTVENIEIYNVVGQLMMQVPLNPPKGGKLLPSFGGAGGGLIIDVSHLPSGIYFIRINNKINKLVKF